MSALTRHLAADSDGAWTVVFEPEELHLYIDFVRPGTAADPASGMTIEDFLARRPRSPTDTRAIVSLVALVCRAFA
ncbi:hypothetical protein A9K72_34630 [Mesorhizobium loti]|nr:hypothetical protein A9K72_34630 [Mesorhizobium loti]